jgi:ribonuclease HI
MFSQNKPVKNTNYIKRILSLLQEKPNVYLMKVKAHQKGPDFFVLGNNKADELAKKGVRRKLG